MSHIFLRPTLTDAKSTARGDSREYRSVSNRKLGWKPGSELGNRLEQKKAFEYLLKGGTIGAADTVSV